MATVYKAYDPRFEREVALKVLPREMLHEKQFRVRFEREAKTIAALEHPAIVPVYDVGEEDGQPYFVMRFMTGGSLQDVVARGPVALAECARIFARLAPALDDAHAKGIIHRDLKPGNILFDRAGEPYISDFGIAKIAQTQGTTVTGGAIIGTPAYMSPEQAQGEQIDGRSDIYALGVILYEMLTGAQPYQATTPMAVVVKHITDPIPHILDANADLPAALEPVVEKAMAKNPDQRFSSAGEFSMALAAVTRGESAEQAIRTASMQATRVAAAAKTRLSATRPANQAEKTAARGGGKTWLVIAPLLVILLLALGAGGYALYSTLSRRAARAALTEKPATQPAAPPQPSPLPPTPLPPTPAAVIPPSEAPTQPAPATETSAPPASFPGGADQVAFVANKEIWAMNLDGSNLRQLTTDGLPKHDLQFIPGTETLVYISGTNIKSLEIASTREDILMSFPSATALDVFRISPDGKQVAISLNYQMFIVPFDLEKLRQAKGRDALKAMKGCLSYTGKTETAIKLLDFRWSQDAKLAAWLFTGVGSQGGPADLIRLVDISTCDTSRLNLIDEFPGNRFTPEAFASNPKLPDFDWDGANLFVFNTAHRNDGWGFLYLYDEETHKGRPENPIASTKSHCCYRDARWSPDTNYLFFSFQSKDTPGTPAQFYYIPVSDLRSGKEFQPIPLPEGFFKDAREAPQPALHPAAPKP